MTSTKPTSMTGNLIVFMALTVVTAEAGESPASLHYGAAVAKETICTEASTHILTHKSPSLRSTHNNNSNNSYNNGILRWFYQPSQPSLNGSAPVRGGVLLCRRKRLNRRLRIIRWDSLGDESSPVLKIRIDRKRGSWPRLERK